MGHHNDYRNFVSFHALGFFALMAMILQNLKWVVSVSIFGARRVMWGK